MRILYGYRYGIVGGVSTQLILRQGALRRAGHDCELFFTQDNGLGAVLTERQGIHFGSPAKFRRLVRAGRFDAVVIIDTPELLDLAAGLVFHRVPVFLDIHTTTSAGLAYLRDVDISKLSGIMVPTVYSSNLVRARLPKADRVSVVPNIIDSDLFAPRPITDTSEEQEKDLTREFVWVGKLDQHKNWRLALIYTALFKQLLGTVRLTLIGGYTAPEKQAHAFFDLACELGVSSEVDWLDRVENRMLPAIYRRSAESGGAMLVTSRDESFGMAAAEALLCGCPLIANDLPVFREVFPDSPLVQLLDIWRPEEVAAAAGCLSRPDTAQVEELRNELAARYGPQAFLVSMEKALGGMNAA
ncbi:glycosyltransferase family 4 protein [Nitratireductor indicus]|uniref:glycosyltransferase family 4 protein n=1 Tax=Nitratireductor indicus TaxID=721133 RepID=UPI0035C80F45